MKCLGHKSDWQNEFKVGDKLWVKLIKIKEDGKMRFTMKGVDQATGRDLNFEYNRLLQILDKKLLKKG